MNALLSDFMTHKQAFANTKGPEHVHKHLRKRDQEASLQGNTCPQDIQTPTKLPKIDGLHTSQHTIAPRYAGTRTTS